MKVMIPEIVTTFLTGPATIPTTSVEVLKRAAPIEIGTMDFDSGLESYTQSFMMTKGDMHGNQFKSRMLFHGKDAIEKSQEQGVSSRPSAHRLFNLPLQKSAWE